MFDQGHRQAGHRAFLSLKPGCWAEFHLCQVYPSVVREGKAEYGGRPYETSPMDVHVYRAVMFDKDSGAPGPMTVINDVLRWDPQSQNIAGLINLADDATERHDGDKTAITNYKVRCDVRQQYNKATGKYFHVYEFRALDAAGNILLERQLPGAPTVTDRAQHQQHTPAPTQQQYQGQQPAQQQRQTTAPAYTPLDELRDSLAVVTNFQMLQQAWAAVSQRLAAAGLVPQAQQLVGPVKRRLLLEEIAKHTDGQMLRQAKADIVRRCGTDTALAAEIGAACDRRIAETTDTGFPFGGNVGGGVDDIPL